MENAVTKIAFTDLHVAGERTRTFWHQQYGQIKSNSIGESYIFRQQSQPITCSRQEVVPLEKKSANRALNQRSPTSHARHAQNESH